MTAGGTGVRGHPLVSVVLPTRNRARWVGRAIDGVLRQTLEDLELIVVDDGSTDESPAVVARYATADRRIRIERPAHSIGAAAARNLGIARARGRFVAFVDDDVLWRPSKLERQFRGLDAAVGAGLAYCCLARLDATGARHVIGSAEATGGRARDALLRRNFIDTSCVVVRRDLLLRVRGFDERLPRLQDWDLWLRLAETTSFVFDPAPLVDAPHVPGGISSDPSALIDACERLVAKYGVRLDRRERGIWFGTLGHTLLTNGAPSAGRRLLWRAFRSNPSSPRCARFAAASLLGTRAYNRIAGLRARRSEVRRRWPETADGSGSASRHEGSAEVHRSVDTGSSAPTSGEAWPS